MIVKVMIRFHCFAFNDPRSGCDQAENFPHRAIRKYGCSSRGPPKLGSLKRKFGRRLPHDVKHLWKVEGFGGDETQTDWRSCMGKDQLKVLGLRGS
jgi:hypothetical protein